LFSSTRKSAISEDKKKGKPRRKKRGEIPINGVKQTKSDGFLVFEQFEIGHKRGRIKKERAPEEALDLVKAVVVEHARAHL
jgi:hypothetical protein